MNGTGAIRIRKGLDIRLAGSPRPELASVTPSGRITIHPSDAGSAKLRLLVKEGDEVKRGTPLFLNKKNEAMKFRSPAGGTVQSIVLGERRVIEKIVIAVAQNEQVEPLPRHVP